MIEWQEYGYAGLFVASFIAATIIPFSSEALLGVLIYSGSDPVICVAVATVGNTLGGTTGYYLGYLGKWNWLEKYIGISKQKIEKFHSKHQNKGSFFAFFSWLPFIGDLIPVMLGVLRFNFWLVTLFIFLGKLTRYIFWGYLSFYLK